MCRYQRMLMVWVMIVLFSTSLLVIFPAQAQDDDTRWYYGWDRETEILHAFNLSGETQELGLISRPDSIFRIDATHLLIQVENEDGEDELRLVTPTAMQTLVADLEEGLLPIAFHDPYLVLIPVRPRLEASPALLVDLEDGTATRLMTASRPEIHICCTFSTDGTTLRYVARMDAPDNPRIADYELRERDLATGDERTFFSIHADEQDQISFSPTKSGNLWLMQHAYAVDSTRHLAYQLMDTSGVAEAIADTDIKDTSTTLYRVSEDYLVGWQPHCEADCRLTFTNLVTETVQSFDFGVYQQVPLPVYYQDDELVVALQRAEYVRLRTDAPPEVLGYWSPRFVGQDVVSPDGRWAVLLDDEREPSEVHVHNLASATSMQILAGMEISYIPVSMIDEYIIVQPISNETGWLAINTATETLIEWLLPSRVSMEAIVSDEQALVASFLNDDLEEGIYLLDHESMDFSPVLSGQLFIIDGRRVRDMVAHWWRQ